MDASSINQGTAHIANVDGDWMVVFPDGAVSAFVSQDAAGMAVRDWFKRDARKRKLRIGIGVLETEQ